MGVGIEPPDYDLLVVLAAALARTFGIGCHIEDEWLDARFAFDAARNQYYSTAILRALKPRPDSRILGVASVDLFVPVLTFVFGEAQLEGGAALVSYYRLLEPGRPQLLPERLAKEAVHELGHTFGLRHCHNWECVMSSSHSVERLDIKSPHFCDACRRLITRAPSALPV